MQVYLVEEEILEKAIENVGPESKMNMIYNRGQEMKAKGETPVYFLDPVTQMLYVIESKNITWKDNGDILYTGPGVDNTIH